MPRHLTTALALCALTSLASAADLQPIAGEGATPPAPWKVMPLPNSPNKPLTRFSVETAQGKRALRVEADKSYANLVHELTPAATGRVLSWSWQIDELNDAADLHNRSGDDTTVKVCALFDMPLEKVPFIERQLLTIARSKTTDPIPAATICYVWDDKLPIGTWIDSPFTHRLHYLVLQSGADGANQWHSEKRDLASDFLKAFGSEDAEVPPLVGIAVGADADNTQRHSVAHVTDVVLAH